LSRRSIAAFAAGISDPNPRYYDDRAESDIVAPPTLPVSLTWKLSNQLARTLAGNAPQRAAFLRQLHVSEELELLRPLRPADCLTITGRVVQVAPHRLGTTLVIGYEARNASGLCAFRERFGLLLRSENGIQTARTALPPEGPDDAAALWTTSVTVDRLAAHVYSACSDIYFAVHTSQAFAESVGLPVPILHGTATMSIAVREVLTREADSDPTRVRGIACRFRSPVVPGEALLVRLRSRKEMRRMTELGFDVCGSSGQLVVSDGLLRFAAPSRTRSHSIHTPRARHGE
jgi:acyl dehydratase